MFRVSGKSKLDLVYLYYQYIPSPKSQNHLFAVPGAGSKLNADATQADGGTKLKVTGVGLADPTSTTALVVAVQPPVVVIVSVIVQEPAP